LEQTVKIAICVFGFFGLFFLVLIAAASYGVHPALSVIFVCGYGALLIFSPRIFRGIGIDQEKSATRFLQETRLATDDLPFRAPGCHS
jgi:hypothetical protein